MPERDRPDSESADPAAPVAAAPAAKTDRPAMPPKMIPLGYALLLLAVLPAVAAGIWFGGYLHRVDDRPPAKPRSTVRPPAAAPRAPGTPSPTGAMTVAPSTPATTAAPSTPAMTPAPPAPAVGSPAPAPVGRAGPTPPDRARPARPGSRP